MKKINLEARIRRNKFDELAGAYYRDESSEIVKHLKNLSKNALLGIQRDDETYTIIGEEYIYYSTTLGGMSEIIHKNFLDILQENALSQGKAVQFEFVCVNETDCIWLMNVQTMNAIWNVVMLLHNNNA
jgi:hypothetical protein